jgi:hypothetical protein
METLPAPHVWHSHEAAAGSLDDLGVIKMQMKPITVTMSIVSVRDSIALPPVNEFYAGMNKNLHFLGRSTSMSI